MSAQDDLAAMSDMGTTNVRVNVQLVPINAWSAAQMRDTFRYYSCLVNVSIVGVGPVFSTGATDKDMDAAVKKTRTALSAFMAHDPRCRPAERRTDTSPGKRKLKLKRTVA